MKIKCRTLSAEIAKGTRNAYSNPDECAPVYVLTGTVENAFDKIIVPAIEKLNSKEPDSYEAFHIVCCDSESVFNERWRKLVDDFKKSEKAKILVFEDMEKMQAFRSSSELGGIVEGWARPSGVITNEVYPRPNCIPVILSKDPEVLRKIDLRFIIMKGKVYDFEAEEE